MGHFVKACFCGRYFWQFQTWTDPFNGEEVHMEMDVEWKWMAMGRILLGAPRVWHCPRLGAPSVSLTLSPSGHFLWVWHCSRLWAPSVSLTLSPSRSSLCESDTVPIWALSVSLALFPSGRSPWVWHCPRLGAPSVSLTLSPSGRSLSLALSPSGRSLWVWHCSRLGAPSVSLTPSLSGCSNLTLFPSGHSLCESDTTSSPSESRERAYIHAVSAAGVAYSITRACSRGQIAECGCDQRILSRKAKRWEWGGCSEVGAPQSHTRVPL